MINLYNAEITSMSLHRVGNKSRNEKAFMSERPYQLNDEIRPLLKEFFLKPFRDKEESYFQFAHEVDLEYNAMCEFAVAIFDNPTPSLVHKHSKGITAHLYEQSNHPHIKNGEVYIVHFSNISVDNVVMDAIGIFKTEILNDFIEVDEQGNMLLINLRQGISLDKLDKGCMIFNTEKDSGYRIMSVDSNRYDARYWLEHFLSVDAVQDDHFLTRQYMKMAAAFGQEVVYPAEDKKAQVMFNNQMVNFFGKNDEFEETAFLNEVLDNPDLQAEFKVWKVDKAEKYSLDDVTTFSISNNAVSDARKAIKNVINLDTNISIHMDFINPESAEKFVEKGWDAEKQMYYYLVYFNKEQKS